MNLKKILAVLAFLFITFESTAFARNYRFQDSPPAAQASDDKPSQIPDKNDFKFVEYAVTSSARYPLVDMLDTRRKPRSLDVNSMDEVPASSWFTPRLGSSEISPEELVKGPEVKGPPQAPLTIVKLKKEGNSPGFIVKDARGLKYLIKFDRSEYPDLESTANFIVSRLFWGFGYHVSEDYIVQIFPDKIKKMDGIDQDEIDKIFIFSYAGESGAYRAVASLFLDGEILGPIPQRGTRKGDSNDLIAHENRRVLRALRMFSAWVDNSGVRSDNSLDVYQGEAGKGHTLHYLLDFGEAFGVHGIEKDRNWDGFEHFFSWGDMAKNFAAFGFPIKKWEPLKLDPDTNLGTFEAELFEPGKWKETTQFLPIRSSQPDDDYWAAKIIASVRPEHLESLFKAAAHPDENYSKSILEILQKRREKIIRYAFERVSPLEFSSLENGKLILNDLGAEHGIHASAYHVRFLNGRGKKILADSTVRGENEIEVPVAASLDAAGDYLIVEIKALRAGKNSARAAQFHIRKSGSGEPKIVGVLH